MSPPSRREDFGLALICALRLEFDAVSLAFDETWDEEEYHFGKADADDNHYLLGRIGNQNVVLVLLSGMGKVSAATSTRSLLSSFSGLKLAILCGICGGVPRTTTGEQILLGDVVISKILIQYDLGRQYTGNFVRKDTIEDNLGRPSQKIRSIIDGFTTRHGRKGLQNRVAQILSQLQSRAVEEDCMDTYDRPADDEDVLFDPDYLHRHRGDLLCDCDDSGACDQALTASCKELGCEIGRQRPRMLRRPGNRNNPADSQQPRVFVGPMGSGDTVMKSAEHRDKVATRHDIIAFEMEGAGVWDQIPCVVVKAVCDYADSHKNKKWQDFAAVAAASVAMAFLEKCPSTTLSELAQVEKPPQTPAAEAVSSGPKFIIPYEENDEFVGRSAILDRIRQHFEGATPRRTVALHGLGGVGKTQIAIAYCYQFQRRFPDASVYWIHASTAQRFHQAFTDIARECQIPGLNDSATDILQLVKGWLENEQRKRWLLVIDNADDEQVFFPPDAQTRLGVGSCIPNCRHGSVLITTRNKQAGLRLTKNKPPIEVGRMTDSETEQLLRFLLDDEENSVEDTSLLSSRLEHLPLALAQAASFMLRNSISIKEYIKLLDKNDLSIVDRLSEPFEAVGRDSETPHALTATWIISFDQIQQQHPLAGHVLSFVSLLDRQSIPKEFVIEYSRTVLRRHPTYLQLSGSSFEGSSHNDSDDDSSDDDVTDEDVELKVTKALGILQAFSFISRAGEDAYDMHRLVQLITRKRLADDGKRSSYAEDTLRVVSSIYPEGNYDNRVLCLRYLPHALAVLECAGVDRGSQRSEHFARLSSNMAEYFRHAGQYRDAERYQKRAVDIRTDILGPEDHLTIRSMGYLAYLDQEQSRLDEAEKLLLKVLEIEERKWGGEDGDTLYTKHALGKVYKEQKRYVEAEQIILEVLEVRRSKLGEEHRETLDCMHELASVYRHTNRHKESEKLSLQIIEAESRMHGEDDPDTLTTMHDLASNFLRQDRLGEAEELLLRVVELKRQSLGEKHPETIRSLHKLAEVYYKQRRYGEEKELLLRVEEASSEIYGDRHTYTLEALSNLAVAQWSLGQKEEARKRMRQCVNIRLQVLGPDNPDTLNSIGWLSDWDLQDSKEKAENSPADSEDNKLDSVEEDEWEVIAERS